MARPQHNPEIDPDESYDSLVDYLDCNAGVANDVPESMCSWVDQSKIVLSNGDPFSFEEHEYLRQIYQDNHPDISIIKATQGGFTEWAILRSFYQARYMNFKGLLYLFPSKTDVTEFSKGRVGPLIEENPDTIGRWMRDTDSANVKQVWNCILYFRGMQSKISLKSAPVDGIVYDELDEAPQLMIEYAEQRMSHSKFKWTVKLSNPTKPDFGIDKAFQATDQRFWLIKCRKCGEWTDLVEEFPKDGKTEPPCIVRIKNRVVRACKKCHSEIFPQDGEWVAKRPSITNKRGYQFSQLYSSPVPPEKILEKYLTTSNLVEFYNLWVGIAYVEAYNRLEIQEILNLCGQEPMELSSKYPCCMGVDQGKDLHVVIGRMENNRPRILHLGVYKHWEDIDDLIKKFKVVRGVVDAMPEMRPARELCKRHSGKIYMNFYRDHHRGDPLWNEENLTVVTNRTESMDASHKIIKGGEVVLPRNCDDIQTFAKHCHNVIKELVEDDYGNKKYVYSKLGADHYRHGQNYWWVAQEFIKKSAFGDLDLG